MPSPYAYVRELGTNFIGNSASASIALTTTHAVAAGDTVIVFVYGNGGSGASVSDGTNTYRQDLLYSDANLGLRGIYSFQYLGGLANGSTITVSFSGGSPTYSAVSASECNGLLVAAQPAADQSASAVSTASTTTPSSGTCGTLAQPNELAFAILCFYNTIPAFTTFAGLDAYGSGWTGLTAGAQGSAAGVQAGLVSAYTSLSATTAGAFSPTLTQTCNFAGCSFVTYKVLIPESVVLHPEPPPNLRAEMRRGRGIGPFPLADTITWLPPGPPLVQEIVCAQPLGALPHTHRIRRTPFIGPFPLADVVTWLPPGPPLVQEIVCAQPLGALPQAHRVRRTPWVQTYPLAPMGVVLIPPSITGVSPNSGGYQGGTAVTITGAAFTGALAVAFGSTFAASFAVTSDTQISAVTRAHAVGLVDVSVAGKYGPASSHVPADQFTFIIPPLPPELTLLTGLPSALRASNRYRQPGAIAPHLPPQPQTLPDVSALLAGAPQPTIPEALLAAQRSATAQPVITAVLRARRASANRLYVNPLYTNALTDDPVAIALPANGNIVRARINGGNVQVNVQPGYGAYTVWGTITTCYTPPAGLGVALAAAGDTVVLAFPSDSTHAAVYVSTNDGASWSLLGTVANTGTIADVAVSARASSGTVTLLTGDNAGVLRAFVDSGAGFGAATSLTPPSSLAINSVAITDFGSDWLVLFGWEDGNVDRIGQAIWGGGGLQTASTWSTVADVLGVDPNSGNTPAVTGLAWGPDGGHAIIVENWAVLGGYGANNAYAMELSNSVVAVLGAYWTEPAPFPYTSGTSTTIFGPDLAYSASGGYVASAENLVAQLLVPADVDVSTRVIAIQSLSQYHSGHTTLILDNSDGELTSLATNRETLGMRLDLGLGYQTIDGPIALPQPQRWVVKAESSWVSGRHLVTLTCHDGWQLLHQLTMRRQAQFGTTLGLPTLTVDQLIHWLCAKAGIDYTAAASTALNARTPNWTAMPGRSLGTLMLDLLDTIEGFLLMTGSGATVIPLAASDPITYAYGGLGDHIVAQAFHTQELQTANLVSVYYGAHGAFILAQAFDPGDAHLVGLQAHEHSDTQLATGSDSGLAAATLGQDTANALLRKVQVSTPTHAIICIPQVGQALGDVVSLVDLLTGAYYLGRVYSIALHYDRDKGIWQHTISLGGV
jgi:IPT/TIG domain